MEKLLYILKKYEIENQMRIEEKKEEMKKKNILKELNYYLKKKDLIL